MKQQLAKQPEQKKASALSVMAARCRIEPQKLHETLKNTVFKGANDHELVALVLVANEYGLNPLVKEIYAFPAKGGGVVPVVGIDGWLKIINSKPEFDGIETEPQLGDNGELIAVEARIYRKDRSRPTIVREYLSECKRKTEPWETMPQRMLRHKAIMQCARIAFSISGITDEDEAQERMVSGSVVDAPADDPLTAGIKPKKEPKKTQEEEPLTLNNELTLDEKIAARAKAMDLPVAALIVEAAEAGLIPEQPLEKLTDEQKEKLLV